MSRTSEKRGLGRNSIQACDDKGKGKQPEMVMPTTFVASPYLIFPVSVFRLSGFSSLFVLLIICLTTKEQSYRHIFNRWPGENGYRSGGVGGTGRVLGRVDMLGGGWRSG